MIGMNPKFVQIDLGGHERRRENGISHVAASLRARRAMRTHCPRQAPM